MKSAKVHSVVKDHFKSNEEFTLVWNDEQDILITTPQPTEDKLGYYYDSDEYISHNDDAKGLMPFLYNFIKKRAIKKKVSLIESRFGGKGSLLDIGAGTGEFCKAAKDANWKVEGVEPNEIASKFAKNKEIKIFNNISEIKESTYDVITLWHVLEHLPDLEKSIEKFSELLKPNGVLIIAVPNFNSYDAKHYKNFWAAFDVPRHLWHFSKQSIGRLFQKDFNLEKIHPMLFDSFYVSLLSEKYKSGNSFSLKALFIGFISNFKAFFSKEHSSIIYCLRKL